jgi:hypothetical protein
LIDAFLGTRPEWQRVHAVPSALRAAAEPIVAMLPFVVYLRTTPPTFYNIDSAELATAAATVGVPHPPGYPLYVLLGHAFTRLPIGDVGFRVNLMSAVWAAATLLLVYFIVMRLTPSKVAAIGAAWLLGFSYPFWSDAIVAEVYTLDAALIAAMMLFLLRWNDTQRRLDLAVAFACFGLSLANRTTNLLCLPAIALFLAPDVRRDGWCIAPSTLATLPGLALYALLPLRSAMGTRYQWGGGYDIEGRRIDSDLTQLDQLWWFVSARVFRPQVEWYGWPERFRETAAFGSDAWGALLGGGLVLALEGLGALALHRRRAAVLVLGIGVIQTAFFINYAAVDKDTMFVHSYVVFAIGAGYGVAQLPGLLSQWPGARLAPFSLLCAAILLIPVNLPLLDLSDDDRARARSEAFMQSADDDALVIGGWTDIAPLEYLQIVEGERRDVALVLSWPISPEGLRAMIAHNLANGRPVYAMRRNLTFWNIELNDFTWTPEEDWFRLELPRASTEEGT